MLYVAYGTVLVGLLQGCVIVTHGAEAGQHEVLQQLAADAARTHHQHPRLCEGGP